MLELLNHEEGGTVVVRNNGKYASSDAASDLRLSASPLQRQIR
jgi:hypothetical protein